jgi:phage minor structural protein
MSYPILYSATETNFDHNGFGILGDCISCEVTEEANGIFELSMVYPSDGIHFEEISQRSIIKAKVDNFRKPQLFRIYQVNKDMSKNAKILAEHISYDLSGIPVSPFSALSAENALIGLKSNAAAPCEFDFWTNVDSKEKFEVSAPSSIRSCLGGHEGSIIDVYGGELEFDNYSIKLYNYRGINRGVSIRYGKNLTDIKQEQKCSNVVTGIYPYWILDAEGKKVFVELPEKIVQCPGTYNFVKIKTVDFSSDFSDPPTFDQLRKRAEKYIEENELGVPSVSLSISYAQLAQSQDYENLKVLERVELFDTVNVEFPEMGVYATAKVSKMVHDIIGERVKLVTIGSIKPNIVDTIVVQQKQIEKKPSRTFMKTIVESLTNTILGAKGGSVRLLDVDGDGEPDTLYIADHPEPTKATKVWRFNYEGWGASDNGYNGPFEMGATFNEGIVADFITTGTLDAQNVDVVNLIANSIVSGVLKSKDEKTYFNLDNDEIVTFNELGSVKISDGNVTLFDKSGSKQISLNQRYISAPDGIYSVGAELSFFGKTRGEIARFSINGDDFIIAVPNDDGVLTPLSPKWKSRTIGGETINYIGL